MLRNSRQGPYLSAGGNSFSSIWGGQCWIMEGSHSGWRSVGEIRGKLFSRLIKSHPSWIVIEAIMRDIAKGMCWFLHSTREGCNMICHSQGPCRRTFDQCLVSDYECSVGVQGTWFWGAPENLLGQKYSNFGECRNLHSLSTEKSVVSI